MTENVPAGTYYPRDAVSGQLWSERSRRYVRWAIRSVPAGGRPAVPHRGGAQRVRRRQACTPLRTSTLRVVRAFHIFSQKVLDRIFAVPCRIFGTALSMPPPAASAAL